MLNNFFRNIPPRVFWLGNILFWLILNTISADNTYRAKFMFGSSSTWIEIWVEYLPWWGNWALIAPFIIAVVRTISTTCEQISRQIIMYILTATVMMTIYWGLTVFEVSLMSNGGILDVSQINIALHKLIRSPLHMDVLVYFSIMGVGLAQGYYAKSQEYAVQSQKLSNQLLEAELSTLKAQLNPHFLFNTLNTISGLVRLDQKSGAVVALSELSHMFRSVLENQNQQLTTLRNEIAFIDSYMAIQKLRFENKISIQLEIEESCLDNELPFMLLHTLVENAVQHGSQLESDENALILKINCEPNWLLVELTNKAATRDDHKGFGIGLKNCRKRLQHIYHDNYHLDCREIENGYFQTKLSIPTGQTDV
jgi:hypothetical protein